MSIKLDDSSSDEITTIAHASSKHRQAPFIGANHNLDASSYQLSTSQALRHSKIPKNQTGTI